MINFLSEYSDGSVGEIAKDFAQLNTIIQQAEISSLANDSYYCDDANFAKICETVSEIRNRYVSL